MQNLLLSKVRLLPWLVIALVAASGVFGGCSGRSKLLARNSGKLYAVTASQTGFYRFGPQQGNGADTQLPRDTIMTLIRPSFGYCKVRLKDGVEGFVASEDIRPAPPTLIAAVTAPPSETTTAPERFDLDSADPRLTAPQDAMPDPDLPPLEDTPAPMPE